MKHRGDRNAAGGRCTRAMENIQTLTNTSGAVNTEEALDARGNAKGERQESG